MIDDMGAHHVLQTKRNPPVNAPRIRRSKNGFRASMALCPRVPGLHIAKSCSGSPHPARPTTRIRAHRKRLRRLGRLPTLRTALNDWRKRSVRTRNSVPASSNAVSGPCPRHIDPLKHRDHRIFPWPNQPANDHAKAYSYRRAAIGSTRIARRAGK
jgi:hypothetical protein